MTNQVDANDRHVRYTTTAGQTVFDFDFPVDDAGNLAVYQNGALVDPANYTVDLDAQTVTLDTGATLGDDISIDGLTVLERVTGYPVAGGLRASLLNEDQNRAIEIAQELRRDQLRSLQFAKNAPIDMNGTLPAANAGKALRWSDDGKSIINSADDIDGILAAATTQAGIATAAAGAASTSATDAAASNISAAGHDTAAASSATSAGTSAATASAAATTATNAIANLSATSTSSVAIGTGSKSFTTQAGKFFVVGQYLQVASAAGPTNFMNGIVTAYSGTTLTLNVSGTGGSGTHADWNIAIAGIQGPAGTDGVDGSPGLKGDTGDAGAPGSVWYEGSGAPSSGTGINGDYYLNIANGDVYTKAAGSWGSPAGNIKGPAGSGTGDMLSTNNLSDVANAGTARTNLGLGTMATQSAGAVAITGGTITGLGAPTNTSDAATKSYVDGLAAGLSGRSGCRVATTAALTATYSNGTSGVGATLTNSSTQAALALDGVTMAVNERVLVKNQATAAQNGIYTVTNVGSGSTNWILTRATDFDQVASNEIVEGAYTIIEEGTVNTGFLFLMTQHSAITVGTTAINWTQLTVSAQSAGSLTGATLSSNVLASSLTSVGTLTGGATGAGFTVALGSSTITGQLTETHGGTNQTGYAKGDILYASAANVLSKLAVGADGTVLTLASGVPSWASSAGAGAAGVQPGGRLTLTSGTPVTPGDVTGATTVYYTPYVSDQIPIYNGTSWSSTTFTELSQLTTDTTKSPAAVTTNSAYDIFVWNDSGTIRATRGPAWTSSTARGTGVGTTELQRLNGILTNKNAITNGPAANRGTYVGTIYTDGSSQVNDSAAKRHCWNAYRRVRRIMANAIETTDSWTYTLAAFRQANANTANQLDYIVGLDEDGVSAQVQAFAKQSAGNDYSVGIGVDSTTVSSAQAMLPGGGSGMSSMPQHVLASYKGNPGLGRHFLAWLEYSTASGATTWYGDNAAPTHYQSGISGELFA